MNPREKMLALAIGGLLLVLGLVYGVTQISSVFTRRQQAIAKVRQGISDRERQLRVARRATQRLKVYREMSLPEDHELAGSLYETWFLGHLEKAKMTNVKISTTGSKARSKTMHIHSFNITASGDLQQFTQLLHQFYSANHLHRLKQCKIEPVKESKLLTITLSIDALSLQSADHTETLNEGHSHRLERDGLAEYERVIVGRNIFGPANKAPKFTSSSSQRGSPDSTLSFTLKASDPDKLDKLRYTLDGNSLPDAKLDPQSGDFRWTPKAKGEFEVAVIATDNGLPPKSDRQIIKLTITDPPPPPPPPKKVLEFDHAKHTKLTGIVDDGNSTPVAWLKIFTTGEILKLREGDKLDVGSIQGQLKRISDNTAEIEAGGKRIVLHLGDPLVVDDTPAKND